MDAARPFAPSWLDVVMGGIRRLPVPAWLVYLVVGLLLSLTRSIVGWVDGSYPAGTFFHIHVFDGLFPLYFLFVIHYLDDLAGRALADYRPKLTGDTGYDELRYRLTTMPAAWTLVVSLFGFALGAVYLQIFLSPKDLHISKYFTSPTSVVVDTTLSGLLGLMMVLFAWHTIRQLRMISRIYTHHTTVSIFDVGALYALSRVTAVTAVALLFFSYIYLAFYANGQIYSVSNVVVLGVILLVAVLTFILPLWGAHRLLQKDRSRRIGDIGRHIETAANALHAQVDAAPSSADMDHLNNALNGLISERTLVSKASTWPWEPEAVRAVITAVLLPIFIWLVTRVLTTLGF